MFTYIYKKNVDLENVFLRKKILEIYRSQTEYTSQAKKK
jgi:hypothetical protein